MPFLYKFLIDNQEIDVEMGFTTSRKWEEALDEASLVVPFVFNSKEPFKMYSLLKIEIIEIEDYESRKIVGSPEIKEYLIFSDKVENVGNYGWYKHSVSAIEYTAKLDTYFINQLAKSRSILTNELAPFTKNRDFLSAGGDNPSHIHSFYAENLNIKKTYQEDEVITFNKVKNIATWNRQMITGSHYVKRDYTYITTNATLKSGTKPHFINESKASWVFPKGEWKIEYGYATYSIEEEKYYYNVVFTFFIEVVEKDKNTMYDVLNDIRDMVSKFGGIEDTQYYPITRIFDIDPQYEQLLKNTQAPQIYLNTATARQMLIYVLSFVNALPRLEHNVGLDTLTLERYNLTIGSFNENDIVGFGGEHNINQIGTRNYQMISQGLSGDFNDPSIVTPSHNIFQSVRSLDILITQNNFGIKLPENAPLYKPIKLVALIPKIKIEAYAKKPEVASIERKYVIKEYENFELDLTNRFINGEEWKLKEITNDFPSMSSKKWHNVDIGLRQWKVENLQWSVGDTTINLSNVFGEVFQNNLISNVVDIAIKEWFELNVPYPFFKNNDGEDVVVTYFDITVTPASNYREWKFRLEYITDERLVIKQDKEDLSQIDFYSEMRQNQEESLVDIVRQSKKSYGDLQRTGNMSFVFTKKHTSLSERYKVGQKDANEYTITQVDEQWHNNYVLSTYYVTRYHNRIQQATFINQAYRPFDNFTKNVLNRHEYYGDYLMVVPPNDNTISNANRDTKIYSNDKTIRQISDILLGNKPTLNSSVSVALVRTDGMLVENPDEGGLLNFISTPTTSRGIKGGFTFTFGFDGNMVAGDGLQQEGTKWFNQAVRYTDPQGRFSRFGFILANELDFNVESSISYNNYPLVKLLNSYVNDIGSDFRDRIRFWCGSPTVSGYQRALVWNKDPLTNANLTYGLSVISHYPNMYVFGTKFFTDNFLVKRYTQEEIDNFKTARIYVYNDNTKYELFDDLYVKSGAFVSLNLATTEVASYDSSTNELLIDFPPEFLYTSWAIGLPRDDGVIDLLVACNTNANGIKFEPRHFRPNVREIGKKKVVTIETIEKSFCDEITYKITNTTNQKVSVYVNLISIGYLEIGESILRTTSHNLSGIGGEINKFIVFVGLNDLETTEYSYTEIIPKECIIK